MTENEEIAYEQGKRAAWLRILNQALCNLGYDSSEARAALWVAEREAAIQALRELCRKKGDNNWPDSLSLQDIIEKHLADHLLS